MPKSCIKRGSRWKYYENPDGTANLGQISGAMLQDIRDTLYEIRNVLWCHNTQEIPDTLRRIEKNTHKPKKKRK